MSEAFHRIAMTAAPIFLARGYDGVSLRGLAKELGIQAASLYHHCPGGKQELYVRVLSTYLQDYRARMEAARGRSRFPAALFRLADWMLENPPVDAAAVLHASLGAEDERELTEALHASVLAPLASIIDEARDRHAVRRDVDPPLAAAAIVALIHGLGFTHGDAPEARGHVHAGLRLLLDGVRS